jgi:hypothetical protein
MVSWRAELIHHSVRSGTSKPKKADSPNIFSMRIRGFGPSIRYLPPFWLYGPEKPFFDKKAGATGRPATVRNAQ